MQCQDLFSGENKKNIMNFSSAELAQRVVKVKNSAGAIFKIFFLFFPRKQILTFHAIVSSGNSLPEMSKMFSWKNIINLSFY